MVRLQWGNLLPCSPSVFRCTMDHGVRGSWAQNLAPIFPSCVSQGKWLFSSKSVLSSENGGLVQGLVQLVPNIGHFPILLRLQAFLGIALNLKTSNKKTNPFLVSRHPIFGRQPGTGVRTQFILKTFIATSLDDFSLGMSAVPAARQDMTLSTTCTDLAGGKPHLAGA